MPYIPEEKREFIAPWMRNAIEQIESEGELNFAITKLIVEWTKKRKLRYATVNEVVGVLICAALEYYRRVGVPYEILKMIANGDVYDTLVPPTPSPAQQRPDNPGSPAPDEEK